MDLVAGYFRVSVARDGMHSPDIYRGEIERYCAYRQLELVEIYDDIDRSGYKESRNRPGLDRLVTDRSRYSAIVIPKLSRFGRSLNHLTELFEVFDRDGIDLVFLDIGIDTSTSQGRLLRHIMAAFAEFESAVKADYARANYRHAIQRGKLWGFAPFGYQKNGPDEVVIVASEAAVIRQIFDRWVSGDRQIDISRWLIRNEHSRYWNSGYIGKILDHHVYAGLHLLDGEFIEGDWEPIIDRATWEKARRMREKHHLQYETRRKPDRGPYLLTGLITCGVCGRKLQHQNRPKGRTDYRCYRVTESARCKGGAITASRVEALVAEAFLEHCRFVVVPAGEAGIGTIGDPSAWANASIETQRRLLASVIENVVLVPRQPGERALDPRTIDIIWRDGGEGQLLAVTVPEIRQKKEPVISDRITRSREEARKQARARSSQASKRYFEEWQQHQERLRERMQVGL